ncbi:MAG: VapE domain-containing protein [Geminicoccaceae bacterium]
MPAPADVAARLGERIGELATTLVGEPNRTLSTRSQLRFGTKGSVAVELDGPERGRWFDHEAGVGGDALTLVESRLGLANGAACRWAQEWLGDAPDLGRVAAANPRSSSSGDQARSAKVEQIVAASLDPAGTVVERYLERRSITRRPLPPCLCHRANAHGRYSALVAMATTAAGEVAAVQQVYLDDEGTKAPVAVPKRTNKARDDWAEQAAVRLPGRSPLILCEGVETALSLWQATGQEVWACLGVANIGKAPVPPNVEVVVARDGDAPGSPADRQIRGAVTVLQGRGHAVRVAEPPEGTDFNDLLLSGGEEAVRAVLDAAGDGSRYLTAWRAGLLCNEEGYPRALLANAIHALRAAPEWQGVLWHNELATATEARRAPPWAARQQPWVDAPWSDREDTLAAAWLQQQGIAVSAMVAGQAVEAVARDRPFHPLRDHLDGLVWDREARLDSWVLRYLGVADTPYARAVGKRWLISAVARIFQPGCKADCVLILEGPQGIRKSSALKALSEPWFTDRLSDLGSKDAAMETRGVWVIEIAELDTMSRAEVGTIKAFISRTHDRFRPPYGKRLVDLPRRCVFAGSVNPEGGYLKDATGGRRFWPIRCGTIDLAALARDRDQLWAEAVASYRAGEPWWLETRNLTELAEEEQLDRYQGDAWDDPIREYLLNEHEWLANGYDERVRRQRPRAEPLRDVSLAEVLEHALGIEKGRWTQADQNRVARCLISMGFQLLRMRRPDRSREWRYRADPTVDLRRGPSGPQS